MPIAANSIFNTYKQKIQSLPYIAEDTIKSDTFLLESNEKKKIEIYYAPFEYVNNTAKIVIIGITPGYFQMQQSYTTIWNHRDQEISDEKLLHEVKKQSSFQGPMRKNLITMLDELGLHKYLEIPSSTNLFDTHAHLVQTNSVIKYPVFYRGKNYNGSTPNMIRTDTLLSYIKEGFVQEINMIDKPLLIPLGVNVSQLLDFLIEKELINEHTILRGFPHPSGGNGHRHRQFAENIEAMKCYLRAYFQS
ncbi:hypothetical protein [Robertmurraya sp. P23]|uniref:hypothetical protein n=1 Tax=Robertmurraya sp. P23 TaxID=3436931 RepID=UPI003D979FD4